jgi:hypothetical protein
VTSAFWRLAQALVALYPAGTDARRWVEGVLARKKGLGFQSWADSMRWYMSFLDREEEKRDDL